jgi:uncharacterized protein YkwD
MATRRRFLALAAASFPLTGCTPFSGPSFQPIRVSEREATAAINAIRADHGAGPVAPSGRLGIVASQQARLMARADRLAHEIKAGFDLHGRIDRAGYKGAAGENISAGYASLDEVLAAWLASPGHRRNLLDPRFTEFGIAAARVSGGRASRYDTYWALVLGAPAAELMAAQAA